MMEGRERECVCYDQLVSMSLEWAQRGLCMVLFLPMLT